MIISSIHIERFRAMQGVDLKIGGNLTAVSGRNATMKSTLLGMIGQPFTISKDSPLYGEKSIEGYDFRSQFKEKFRLSKYDIAGMHEWTLNLANTSYYSGKDRITIISSTRKSKGHADTIRFINSEGKTKGKGYIQLPVIYLSLSRLFPVGETGKTHVIADSLSEEEQKLFIQWYKRILSVSTLSNPVASVELKDTKHVFAGISDDIHDVFTNSAGESNVGRILISILSLKRLKDKHGKDYKGGILLIDELDATLFGFAQQSIVGFLYDISKEYKIQIVFSTHSPIILSCVNKLQRNEVKKLSPSVPIDRYSYQNEIIYLSDQYDDDGKRRITGDNIHLARDLHKILNLINLQPYRFVQGIHAYCEDDRAANLVKTLFSYRKTDISQYIAFVNIDLGWGNYYQLHIKHVPEFLNSIIILDNDVTRMKKEKDKLVYFQSAENVLFTPVDVEQGMFEFLREHKNFNEFERRLNEKGYYFDYSTCFSSWPEDHYSTDEVKGWFKNLEEKTSSVEMLFQLWCERNEDKVDEFISAFAGKYNAVAERMNLDSWHK